MLHNIHKMPKPVHPAVISREDSCEDGHSRKRRPQDGRIKTEKDGKR